jgi:hypothetical protein
VADHTTTITWVIHWGPAMDGYTSVERFRSQHHAEQRFQKIKEGWPKGYNRTAKLQKVTERVETIEEYRD